MLPLEAELAPIIDFPSIVLTPETLSDVRRIIKSLPSAEVSDMVDRTDHDLGGLEVRVLRAPSTSGPLPCILSIHGGGYILGTNTMDDPTFDSWCPKLGVVGASVEYRLAPETPYPGPLEDCYHALTWLHENAHELGIDGTCIGIRGVSAGGGLAAALALLARDRGGPLISFQLLDCPMLDDRLATRSINREGLYVWTRDANEFAWRSYLGELYGGDVPYTAAPARAEDLSGLPAAFVSVGSIDGFHDEDVDYACRLNAADVPTELHVYPGAPHAYGLVADTRLSQQSKRDQLHWLQRQLARRHDEQPPSTPRTSL